MNCRTIAIFAAVLLCGCANYSPVSTESLRAPSHPRTLVFDSDFLYTNSKPGAVQRYVGLLAGPYRALLEDDRGVYYKGQGASVLWANDPETHTEYLADGGIWISKVPGGSQFKIYRFIGTEVTRSTLTGSVTTDRTMGQESTTNATTQIAANKTLTGTNLVVSGVGSAIGVAIAVELAKIDIGKIKFDRDDPPPQLSIEGRYRVEN